MNTFYINFVQIENAEYFNVDMLSNDQEIYTKKSERYATLLSQTPTRVFSVIDRIRISLGQPVFNCQTVHAGRGLLLWTHG